MERGQVRERAVVYDLGGVVEVDVGAWRKPIKGRRGKWRQTSETQKRINRQAKRRYFRRKVMINFGREGSLVTLTYDDEHLRDSIEDVQRDVRNWVRCCQRLYKRAGEEFRAMWVYEIGEETGRAHVHVVLNRVAGVSIGEVLGKWRKAHNLWDSRMEWGDDGFEAICAYMVKQEAWKTGYSCTRNLREPEPEDERRDEVKRINRVFTRERCAALASGAMTQREINALFPGFVKVMDGMVVHYNVYTHTYTIHMRLLRPSAVVPDFIRTREFAEAEALWIAYQNQKECEQYGICQQGAFDGAGRCGSGA